MALNFDGFSDSACMPVLHYGDEMTVIPFDGVFALLGVFDDGGLSQSLSLKMVLCSLSQSCFQSSPSFTNVNFSTFAWYFVDSVFLVVWMLVFVGVEYCWMKFVGCMLLEGRSVRGLTNIG